MGVIGDEPTIMYKIFNYIHIFFTTWYVAELFLIIFIMIALVFLFIIFKDYKLYIFIIKDKIKFIKYFSYHFYREKKNFIRDLIRTVVLDYKKFIAISFIFIILGCLIGYLLIVIVPSLANS